MGVEMSEEHFLLTGAANRVVLLLPSGLDDFAVAAATDAQKARSTICRRVLGSVCIRFGPFHNASSSIAAGLELVAFLPQVCIKVIGNRLVDMVPAVRRTILDASCLEDAREIGVDPDLG